MTNRHVYKRRGIALDFVSTVMSRDPQEAAEKAAETPGKYVVTDSNFTEVTQVYVRLTASLG